VISPAIVFARAQRERFLAELRELLAIPSVSTQSQHRADLDRAAEWVAADLRRIGMEGVTVSAAHGHPIVYGEWLRASGRPTVLCYGHYDVQPPEPFGEWVTPPFAPAVRDGRIYARGATDDKGQFHTHLKAVEALMAAGAGALPVNVRFIVEGEEEIAGPSVAAFLQQSAERLRSDCALISDSTLFVPGLPTLCIGLRGAVSTEIEVRGARTDLHSGVYGGVAPNPLVALAGILSRLKDAEGRISIPGFYERVPPTDPAELRSWQGLPFDPAKFRDEEMGARDFAGEAGYGVLERMWARPTLDVHGIVGGYAGEGSKMVIPARATAKVSMRLVPDQHPDEIFQLYSGFVGRIAPAAVEVEVRRLSQAEPVVLPRDNRFVQAAQRALRRVFEREPVLIRSGGSIPVVSEFARGLGIPSVLMGFGLPDSAIHAPNENLLLANYYHGIESVILFLEEVGGLPGSGAT